MNIKPQTSNPDFGGKYRTLRRTPAQCMLGVLAAGIVLCAWNTGAQAASSGPSFDSFRIIPQRNIFDPNRSGGRVPYIRQPQHTHTQHVVDAFALVGTMSYEKGKFAFFDGESSQYKKVLEPGAIIAGYTVKEITPKAVTLAANGKEFQMKVGTQLRNAGADGWQLSTRADTSSDSNSDQNVEAAGAQPSALPPTSSPEMSEVIKHLMEKRAQELKAGGP